MTQLDVVSVDTQLESAGAGALGGALKVSLLLTVYIVAAAVLGGIGLAIAMVSSAIAAIAAIGWPPARDAMSRWGIDWQLARRRRARYPRMRQAHGVHRAELEELTARVNEIELVDPGAAAHYQLDDVLDDYVELAVACQRMMSATHVIDPLAIAARLSRLEGAHPAAKIRELHRGILERRARHHGECTRSIETLRARLAMIADYVRLVSERIAPGVAPDHQADEIVARLGRLDAAEAEILELTA